MVKVWSVAKQRWKGKAAETEGLRTTVRTSPGEIKKEKLLPFDLLLIGKGPGTSGKMGCIFLLPTCHDPSNRSLYHRSTHLPA